MLPDAALRNQAVHSQLVATGRIPQWRVGLAFVVYPTVESYDQVAALAQGGQTATFDVSHPVVVTPTAITGPQLSVEPSGEAKETAVMLTYCIGGSACGRMVLSHWTPSWQEPSSLPRDQQAEQLAHDTSCRGLP